MEELDILKKDWNKNRDNFPKISEREIYAMLHKKSSTTVKWILIISILEFAFWGIITLSNVFFGNRDLKAPLFVTIMDYINYVILIGFILLFYRNYRRITIEKPVKELMATIIDVRKIVKAYVIYNLIIISVSMLSGLYMFETSGGPHSNDVYVIVFSVIVIAIIIMLLVLVYRLLYGRLLKKLNKNYNELKKIKF